MMRTIQMPIVKCPFIIIITTIITIIVIITITTITSSPPSPVHHHHHHHHHHHDHHHQFTTIMLTVCLVSVRKEVDGTPNNHLQELEKSMRKTPSTILSIFIVLRYFFLHMMCFYRPVVM